MYYRYELWVEGEPQDIGFLRGLEEIGCSPEEVDALFRPFDERLPLPPDEVFAAQRTQSWFTEYGLEVMRDAVDDVIAAYEERGGDFWEVVLREEEQLDGGVYEDDYQVLVRADMSF